MQLNKNITRLLTLSILFNNIYFNSNAKTLNRYETLEGESVVLTDVEAEDITEIEIFGNTVQDENDLTNIQSVGELHVNEKGEPILDSQGREQYKIELNSSNYYYQNQLLSPNLQTNPFSKATVEGEWNRIKWDIGNYYISTKNVIDGSYFKNGDKIYVKFDVEKLSDIYYSERIWCGRHGGYDTTIFSGDIYNSLPLKQPTTLNTIINHNPPDSDPRTFHLDFGSYSRNIECDFRIKDVIVVNLTRLYGKGSEPTLEWCNKHIKFQNNNDIHYEPKNITTILLPCQLMKIGEMADKLYWDNKKGKYIIQKRIIYDNFTKGAMETQNWANQVNSINFHYRINDFFGNWGTIRAYCNALKAGTAKEHYGQDTFGFITDTAGIVLKLPKDELSTLDINGCIDWLNKKNAFLYYVNKEAEIVETNITNKIKLPIYNDKTFIFTDNKNGINPTLKIAVDRIEQVSQEAVNQAESNSTSSNIALARLFVNQLPDSLNKDQLQEKLNNLFSKDLVLEKYNSTANLDIYIKSENLLSMSLDTNLIMFDDYSGIDEMEKLKAINISINSSLPYSLNAYIPSEIKNTSNTKTMDLSVLNIKESNENIYKTFNNTSDKLVLKDNCIKGNNKSHSIDLKLASDLAHEADIYKTVLKFEAQQK